MVLCVEQTKAGIVHLLKGADLLHGPDKSETPESSCQGEHPHSQTIPPSSSEREKATSGDIFSLRRGAQFILLFLCRVPKFDIKALPRSHAWPGGQQIHSFPRQR